MKILILLVLSFQLFAKSHQQRLEEWTALNEIKMLERYQIIQTDWFSRDCLKLASKMKFDKIIKCNVLDSEELNAYVLNNGHVYFSKPLMKLINNKHQWASILAHENAHLELNHYIKRLIKLDKPSLFFTKSRLKKFMKKQEEEADQWASNYLKDKGFDENQIYYFFNRVAKAQESKMSTTHKRPKHRMKKHSKKEIFNNKLISLIETL